MIRRLIWLMAALLAICVIAFMLFTPTPSADGGGWLNWVWASGR